METSTPAFVPKHEVIKMLQGLIALNIDASRGFRQAAEQLRSATLSHVCHGAADERESFARELQKTVAGMGETPRGSGTAAGEVHRWWMGLRGRISEGDEFPLLAEAERGEKTIRERYEGALKEPVGDRVHTILVRQFDSIRRSCDTVCCLRKSAALA